MIKKEQKELLSNIKKYKELQLSIKKLEDEASGIKAFIVAEMDIAGVDEMIVDLFTVRNTSVTTSRFDTTAFKKTHSELYKQYSKESTSKRFSIV